MTSDAKIGLLLGLVFIFIIAFIINGLPDFRHNTNNNELTTNMISFDDNSPGIGTKERKAQEALSLMEPVEKRPFNGVQVSADSKGIRSVTPLPGNSLTAEEPNQSTKIGPRIARDLPSSVSAQEAVAKSPQPAKQTWPKIYVVSEGDSLASIAKKLYSPEEGNKRINIDRIFEANRKQLRSPDEIYVGQKLIIPPPSNLARGEGKTDSVFSDTLFEKVGSIGRKQLWDPALREPSADAQAAKQGRWYVVREGDSLWKIAAEQLGNGNRYKEISKLNPDILADEDNLTIGMRLKMPAR